MTPDSLPLPERVREVIGVRLERLSEGGWALAGLAAVIGREFEFELLQRASGLGADEAAGGVEELVRRRVLHAVHDRFNFVHDRVREVAYAMLLPIRRKLLHRHVAAALEALHAHNLEPHVAALGQHYHDGEVWDKAFAYLRKAGSQANDHSAYRRASVLYEHALSALDRLSGGQNRIEDAREAIDLSLQLRIPLVHLAEHDRINAVLAKAGRLAEDIRDFGRLAQVLVFQAYECGAAADYRRGLELVERAIAMPRSHGSVAPPESTRVLGVILFWIGEYRSAVEALKEAERHYDSGLGRSVLWTSVIAIWEVFALVELGEFEDALVCIDRGFRAGEELSHHHSRALAAASRGIVAAGKGDTDAAISALERAVSLTIEGQYDVNFPVAAAWLGYAYLHADRVDDALTILQEAVRRALPTQTWCSLFFAEACLHAGRGEEARQLAERSLATAIRNGERGTHARSLWLLGEITARFGSVATEGAESPYREGLALATELHMRPLVARCHLGLGKLYRRIGKNDSAVEHLTTATTMYREMDMRFWLRKAEEARQEP
jgi:tetratricopeptide (TPR) repeat protein